MNEDLSLIEDHSLSEDHSQQRATNSATRSYLPFTTLTEILTTPSITSVCSVALNVTTVQCSEETINKENKILTTLGGSDYIHHLHTNICTYDCRLMTRIVALGALALKINVILVVKYLSSV